MKKMLLAILLAVCSSSFVTAETPVATKSIEEVSCCRHCHPIIYYVGKGLYYAGKAILPKRFECTVYTKDGKTVKFIRYGETAWGLKKRLWFNARTGHVMHIWRTKDDQGLTLRIPYENIQNISVVKSPKNPKVKPVTQSEINGYFLQEYGLTPELVSEPEKGHN